MIFLKVWAMSDKQNNKSSAPKIYTSSTPSVVHYLQVFPLEGFSIPTLSIKINKGFFKIHPKTCTYNEFLRLNSNLSIIDKITNLNLTAQTVWNNSFLPMAVPTSYQTFRQEEPRSKCTTWIHLLFLFTFNAQD